MATVDKTDLEGKVLPELQEMASSLGVEGHQRLKKGDLIEAIIARANGGTKPAETEVSPVTGEPPSEPPRASTPTHEREFRGGRDGGRDGGRRDDRRGRRRGRDRDRDRDRGPRGIPEPTEE